MQSATELLAIVLAVLVAASSAMHLRGAPVARVATAGAVATAPLDDAALAALIVDMRNHD